jgi:hypothetical protein
MKGIEDMGTTKYATNAKWYRLNRASRIDTDSTAESIRHSERQRHRRPSKAELDIMRELLNDFKISCTTLPEFRSLSELQKWQRRQIDKKLA